MTNTERDAIITRQAEELKEWETAALIECDVCGGSGFSGYGTGYDAVCDCSGGHIGRLKPEDLPELMERNKQLRNQLDAKDTEIAGLKNAYEIRGHKLNEALGENDRLRAQIAERDATIAKMARCLAWYENEAAEEARRFHFGTVPSDIGRRARDLLQSLKEPNP